MKISNLSSYGQCIEFLCKAMCVGHVDAAKREDSCVQHDGRVRSFPHERGNWASCVFIPLLLTTHQVLLDSFTSYLSELLR